MNARWVVGSYTGDDAKHIKSHADAGIGYFVLREGGRGTAYKVEAAFKRAEDSALPPHLTYAPLTTANRLEAMSDKRHGRKTGK
jgi:hypothetical protein